MADRKRQSENEPSSIAEIYNVDSTGQTSFTSDESHMKVMGLNPKAQSSVLRGAHMTRSHQRKCHPDDEEHACQKSQISTSDKFTPEILGK